MNQPTPIKPYNPFDHMDEEPDTGTQQTSTTFAHKQTIKQKPHSKNQNSSKHARTAKLPAGVMSNEIVRLAFMAWWPSTLTQITLNSSFKPFLNAFVCLIFATLFINMTKRTLKTGWLIHLLALHNPLRKIGDQPTTNPCNKTTGYTHEFKPQYLRKIILPQVTTMHGKPGKGLNNTHFDPKAVSLGQLGELNFAKALHKINKLDKLNTFWSVKGLNHNLQPTSKSDIDCVIATNNTLWLIDIKYYKGGKVTYTVDGNLLKTHNRRGELTGKPRKMSNNMATQQERWRQKYGQHYTIKTAVVFMPTHKGAATLKNVTWPGDIKAYNVNEFLPQLPTTPTRIDERLKKQLIQHLN